MGTFLQYREESLAQVINEELITFLQNYNERLINTVPFLVFPHNLGLIVAKCVRYHAAIYNLAAFRMSVGTRLFLIVCKYHHVSRCHLFWFRIFCRSSFRDSEEVDPPHLFFSVRNSIIILSSKRSKRNLGLYPRDTNAIETSSAVASSNSSVSSSISLNLNELESSQVSSQGSTLSLSADSSNPEDLPALELPLFEEDLVNEFSEETQGVLGISDLNKFKDLNFLKNQLKLSYKDIPILFQPCFDYDTDFHCFGRGELNTVVELYNIPVTYTSEAILQLYNFGFGIVKWCDDSHALLIFSIRDHATMALSMEHPFIRARPMIDASPIATLIACMIDFPTVLKYAHNMQRSYRY